MLGRTPKFTAGILIGYYGVGHNGGALKNMDSTAGFMIL